MDLNLAGKVVAITGGSEGIGYAMAEAFAKEGCRVAICSRSQEKLDKAKAEFQEKGFDLYVRSVDVSDSNRLYAFVEEVKNDLGRIDIWINNTATTVVSLFRFCSTAFRMNGCPKRHFLSGQRNVS